MATVNEVIDCALKYVGIVEKPNNNVIFNTAYYGHEVNGAQYPWCAAYVWYVFRECKASALLCDGQKTALCQYILDYFRSKGRFFKTGPRRGDLVFFKFGNSSRETNHIGFVVDVLSDGIITVEGNTSDSNQANGGMVMKKKRNSNIVGFGRPAYDDEITQPKPKPIFSNVYPQKGVDVASWQTNVDYMALRQAGVKFAAVKIIRKDLSPDAMFETHFKGFTDVGIPVRCVYNYSYATTVEKAKLDAHRVLEILNGRKIPVALDVEDKCQQGLGERLIQIINAYQSVIQSAGLKFCVYTGLSFYEKYIKPFSGKLNNTQFWIARYPGSNTMKLSDSPDLSKKPDIKGMIAWQYSQNGSIPEAYKGALDFDLLYSPIVEQSRKTGVCTAATLRVRSTPDTASNKNVVSYIKKGDLVVVYATDMTTGWYQIDLEGKRWVSSKYIRLN